MESGVKSKRPWGITIMIIWFVMEGVYYFYTNSIGMFGGQNISSLFGETLLENSLIVYGFGLAISHFFIAWCFMEKKYWIRVPTIIIFIITTGITGILTFFGYATMFEIIFSVSLAAIIIIYLMKSNVKEYFAKTSSSSYSSTPMSSNKIMKKTHVIIIGISVPLTLFGIFVLIIASTTIQINSDSDRWMVELEPHLQMSSDQLFPQIQNENVEQLKIYRITSLDRYLETISSVLSPQFKNSINTDVKFVFYIDKNSKYSKNEIQEILLNIDGIKKVERLHDWLLNK